MTARLIRQVWRRVMRLGVMVSLAVTAPSAVWGEPPRAPGASTGDGSTAFTGLAHVPEANMFIGAATTAIPISVPPGRKNLTPKLELAYSGTGGPGPYGVGWDLPIGRMQRSGKRGVLSCTDPTYRNDFVLVLPGASQECTLGGDNRCRPTVEEAFVRVEYSANRWDVWDRSGLHYVFGETEDERLGTSVTALFTAGQPCVYTAVWALNRIEDLNGNFLDVTYQKVDGVLYPEAVRYGGNRPAAFPHVFTVIFNWMARPAGDQVTAGTAGFPATLTRLLSSIDVRYGATAGRVVRSYRLQYEFQSSLPARLARQSFLTAVTLYDGDGSSAQALARTDGLPASTTFLYHENRPETGDFGFSVEQYARSLPTDSPDIGRRTLRGTLAGAGDYRAVVRDILDMNGDGIPDLVDRADCSPSVPQWKVYLGSKKGFATTPVIWTVPAVRASVNFPVGCTIRFTSVSGADAAGWYDTFDINGDGIPDFVDATAWTWNNSTRVWNVYLGHPRTGHNGWGFGATPIAWPAPLPYLRRSYGVWFAGNDGIGDTQDLVDVNGDGLLDVVSAPSQRVWLNGGSGFETGLGQALNLPYPYVRFSARDGQQVLGIYDINGDGLPDHLIVRNRDASGREPWDVSVNTGLRFAPAQRWLVGATLRPCDRLGMRDAYQHGHPSGSVGREFFDINGDGLPDLVDVCGWSAQQPFWQVYLNRGGAFAAEPVRWRSPLPFIRRLDDEGLNTYADAFDADGDALVDLVDFSRRDMLGVLFIGISHHAGGAWAPVCDTSVCVAGPNNVLAVPDSARPDLLVQMENGIGSTTYLTYRPSTEWDNTDASAVPRLPFVIWTLTEIEQDDGLCGGTSCETGGAHGLRTAIQYRAGKFSSVARDFRGFGTVLAREGGGRQRVLRFHQDAARKGKMLSAATFAPGANPAIASPLTQVTYVWECVDPAGGSPSCPDVLGAQRRWVRLARTNRDDTDVNTATRKRAWTQYTGWDAYGNVTTTTAGGDRTAAFSTYTSYALLDVAGGPYVVDRPIHMWGRTVGATDLLEETWYFYDENLTDQVTQGNLSRIENWLNQSAVPARACTRGVGGQRCATTTMGYDVFGNVIRVTDANGAFTVTTYDGATHVYPVVVTNAARHAMTNTYDPGCGRLLTQTVAYPAGESAALQPRSVHTYDTFCRLRSSTPPDGVPSNAPRRYAYFLGNPTDIVVREASAGSADAPTAWVTRHALFDALGRRLQGQRDAVVDGAAATIVEGTVLYGSEGEVTHTYAPFLLPRTSSQGVYARPDGVGVTQFEYDALGRVRKVTNPDGSSRTIDTGIAWQTTTTDECLSAGTCPGSRTVELFDAFGRVQEKQVYNGANFETRTAYQYDGHGRLTQTVQGTTPTSLAASTTIRTGYDSLGRKVQLQDPDSGTWQYGYDLVGNLVYQNDPRSGQHIQMAYDVLGRVLRKEYFPSDPYCAPGACAAAPRQQITYTYDQSLDVLGCSAATCSAGRCNLGRLTQVSDLSGSTTMCHDVRGRQAQVITSIVANASTTVADTRYSYDVADHVVAIDYPDHEHVTHEYDTAGQLQSVTGSDAYGRPVSYLSGATYDLFGRIRQLPHGNGVTDVHEYGNATAGYRLSRLTTIGGPQGTLQDLLFQAYQPNGLLRRIADGRYAGGNVLNNAVTFGYDGLGRLVEARADQYVGTYAYGDKLGNLTAKDGAALQYDPLRPHQATRAVGVAMTHDANGNRTSRGTAQSYRYDAEDRLIAITSAGGAPVVEFSYDYSAHRVAKVLNGGASVSRYVGRLAEVTDGWLTKYYYAGDLLLASQRVPAAPLLAGFAPEPVVQVAGMLAAGAPRLVLSVRSDVGSAAAVAVLLAGVIALGMPWRRRAVRQLAIARGHVFLITVAFGVAALPVALVRRPAAAATSTATLPLGQADAFGIMHFHLDHLGSTQVITRSDGTLLEHIRYKAFGEIRGRWGAGGAATNGCGDGRYCREFTGYDTEPVSGLQYANLRFYDPALGMFLTHDPARQFANPYAYVAWSPSNATDPTGAFLSLFAVIIIGLVAGAAASGIQAAVNGAALPEALKAAAIGGAIGGVTSYVGATILQPALEKVVIPVLAQQLANAGVGNAHTVSTIIAYGTANAAGLAQAGIGVTRGEYVGVIGMGLSIGLTAGLDGGVRDGKTATGSGTTDAGLTEFELRPGDVLATDEGLYARTVATLDPTGDLGHTQLVLERDGGALAVLTSDTGGQRVAEVGDRALSGRGFVVYRALEPPHMGSGAGSNSGVWAWLRGRAAGGGVAGYLGNWGANVCSSTVNSALQAGGINTGFPAGSFVTPNGLARSPALGRVGRVPFVP